MHRNKLFVAFVIVCIGLAACAPPPLSSTSSGFIPLSDSQPVAAVNPSSASQEQPAAASSNNAQAGADHHSDVDLTHLEVGDGKYSTSPQVGYVYSCMTQFNGGGATGTGSWMNGDGTWDATKKAVVDGSVTWPSSFTVSLQGDQRVFTGNDLPDHPTGNYPVSSSDDAYAVDRNPNSIQEQSITLSLPVNPIAAAQPNCVGGEVGILLSGVAIFNAFDAEGHDAVAHEVQDGCDGHPQVSGFYHYHSLSDCVVDTSTSGHSSLVGYAFDGYGIYGYYGEDGAEVTNEDLDACHGHTHVVEWDGQMVEMYHYHATHEFPYTVGCFHGTPAVRALSTGGVPQGNSGQGQGQNQPAGQNQSTGPVGGAQGGQGQQPPQEAISACSGLSVGASCSINTPNGTLSGTCGAPPNSTQLACMPAGGPPP
ncbi:MAG: YHYH protein [Chloroflexi bacterium]|nr:YHYH protein [Chloroflexota bacterium]